MSASTPDEQAKAKVTALLEARIKSLPDNIRPYTTLLADIEHAEFPEYDILSHDPRLWAKHFDTARARLEEHPIEGVQRLADAGDWDMMIELSRRYYSGCTIDQDKQRALEILNLMETMLEEEMATPGGDQEGAADIMPLLYRFFGRIHLDTYEITQSSDDLFEAADRCVNALFFTHPAPAPVDLRAAKLLEETLGYVHAGRAQKASSDLSDLWDAWDEYKRYGPGAYMCAHCRKQATPERKLLKCAGCLKWRKPSYCSPACQRADWKGGHKDVCEKTQSKAPPVKAPEAQPLCAIAE